jgi:hypothetical protein
MATTVTFVTPELVDIGFDAEVIRRKAILAGYTHVEVIVAVTGITTVTVNETTSKPVIKGRLEQAPDVPNLYVDFPFLSVKGCGNTTGEIEVRDSRGAGAAGKEVKLLIGPGVQFAVDQEIATLDADGKATFTFGPTPGPNMFSARIPLSFAAVTDEAIPVDFDLQFTRGRRAAQVILGEDDNGHLKYEAVRPGAIGTSIAVAHVVATAGATAKDIPLSISVPSTNPPRIKVEFGTDSNSAPAARTAQEIAAAFAADPVASEHVRVGASGNGQGFSVLQISFIALTGGQDA